MRQLLLLCLTALLFSCKEKGPVIDYSVPQTDKVVLIEEFTGVRCVNCPAGHEIANQIINQYPGRVIAISIHAGQFAVPYNNLSDDTFKITEGTDITDWLGPVSGYPAATIDRMLFANESEKVLVSTNKWAGYVSQQLAKIPEVNLSIDSLTVDSTRQLRFMLTIQYISDITYENRVSIAITEDSIIDPQADSRLPSGLDTFYVHENILRALLTPFNGNIITEEKKAGVIIKKSFSLPQMPSRWKINHCKVIAYIHKGGSKPDIMQAAASRIN